VWPHFVPIVPSSYTTSTIHKRYDADAIVLIDAAPDKSNEYQSFCVHFYYGER